MNLHKHWVVLKIAFTLSILIMPLAGCMAASALKGKQGVDVSAIKAGISKAEVEEILGPPVRHWKEPSGIGYCLYHYDAGVPKSVGDAAAHAYMDVATLGVWELFGALDALPEFRITEKMAISYDARGMVIGVFDRFNDFDELPLNGDSNE